MQTEDEFKATPRLRWELDEDRTVIARAIRQPFRGDHLYWHGPNKLAVYYQARTRKEASCRVRRYRTMLRALGRRVIEHHKGDLDGILIYLADGPGDVLSLFVKSDVVSQQSQSRLTASRARALRQKQLAAAGPDPNYHPARQEPR